MTAERDIKPQAKCVFTQRQRDCNVEGAQRDAPAAAPANLKACTALSFIMQNQAYAMPQEKDSSLPKRRKRELKRQRVRQIHKACHVVIDSPPTVVATMLQCTAHPKKGCAGEHYSFDAK